MSSRKLTEAASHFGGVGSDSTMTRTCKATGEALLIPSRLVPTATDLPYIAGVVTSFKKGGGISSFYWGISSSPHCFVSTIFHGSGRR